MLSGIICVTQESWLLRRTSLYSQKNKKQKQNKKKNR